MGVVKYSPVTIDGILYINPQQAAELMGLNKNSIYALLNRHPEMTFEDAIRSYLNKGKNKIGSNRVEYNGVTYRSIYEACLDLGLNANTIYYRMKADPNLTFSEAIGYDRDAQRRVDGSGKGGGINLSSYCKEHNLDYSKMYRLINSGMSIEEAANKVVKDREKNRLEYNGIVYSSLLEACLELGLTYQNVYNRIKKGHEFAEAIEFYINKKARRG